jgi:hypothetical protein
MRLVSQDFWVGDSNTSSKKPRRDLAAPARSDSDTDILLDMLVAEEEKTKTLEARLSSLVHLRERVAVLERELEAGARAAELAQAEALQLRRRVAALEAEARAAELVQAEALQLRERVAELEAQAVAAALGKCVVELSSSTSFTSSFSSSCAESQPALELSLSPPRPTESGGAAVAAVVFDDHSHRDSEAFTGAGASAGLLSTAGSASVEVVWTVFRQTDK